MATTDVLLATGLFIVLLATRPILCGSIKEGTKDTSTVEVYNEQLCLREGGICLPKVECPEGNLSNKTGLCPEQSNNGVECCHGISINERSCRGLGGECVSYRCPKQLTMEAAEDCSTGEKCCVLV